MAGNVYRKLSGMVRPIPSGGNRRHLKPYVDVAVSTFGPKRLMYGSAWPVMLLAAE